MVKTILLVVAGLAAGLAVAFWLEPSAAPSPGEPGAFGGTTPVGPSAQSAGASPARLAALEEAFAAEVEQRVALEARVAELQIALEALGERPVPPSGEAAAGGPDLAPLERMRARLGGDASQEERERRIVEQLIAAGFAPDRAEWINRRTQELRMEALQAQYDARREGRFAPPGLGESGLRQELGDAEYERYLTALGRATTVRVDGVLASSPAERSGLRSGDEIVAYDGRRVFDLAELNELTLAGTAGQSVAVDVRRDGQNLQLVLPRGPIGVFGGMRGPPLRMQR